jgi:hypothetical protein
MANYLASVELDRPQVRIAQANGKFFATGFRNSTKGRDRDCAKAFGREFESKSLRGLHKSLNTAAARMGFGSVEFI